MSKKKQDKKVPIKQEERDEVDEMEDQGESEEDKNSNFQFIQKRADKIIVYQC